MSRMATCPRVLPSPIMPRSTVPGGLSFVDDLSRPALEIVSLVLAIRQKATSPLLTHGMPPFQSLASERLGVAPTITSKARPREVQHHPSGSAGRSALPGSGG